MATAGYQKYATSDKFYIFKVELGRHIRQSINIVLAVTTSE